MDAPTYVSALFKDCAQAEAALVGLGAGAVTGTIVGGLLELGDHADDWHDWVEKGGAVVAVSLKSPDDRENVRAALA